jgi:hypothetical protein
LLTFVAMNGTVEPTRGLLELLWGHGALAKDLRGLRGHTQQAAV